MSGAYATAFRSGRVILADGPTGTRMRFGTPWQPDPHVKSSVYAMDRHQARAAGALCANYLTIAREFGLPLLAYAPTTRASPDRCRAAGLPFKGEGNVNEQCIRLLRAARDRVQGVEAFIAGVVGPAHDAFDPDTGLAAEEARTFHAEHADVLVEAGCDLLIAAPFPTVAEASGVAQVLAGTGTDYLIAFVVGEDGELLEGTPLGEAVELIDDEASPPPVHYVLQCVHPRRAGIALDRLAADHPSVLARVGGVKANAADARASDLDNSSTVQADEPETWARLLHRLRDDHGTTVLGGCCGTDERHLFSLALRMTGALTE